MHHRIVFALDRQGRLVDIHSVPQGLACGCVCPGCGGRLLAKQGQIRAWYFSDASGAECVSGAETALHLAAKRLILEHRSVALPPLVVNFKRLHPGFGLFEHSKTVDLPEKVWRLSEASAESRIGTYIADVAGHLDDRTEVVVEVKVRHEVEPEKAKYLRARRVPCIEIDLLTLLEESLTLQELAWHVLDAGPIAAGSATAPTLKSRRNCLQNTKPGLHAKAARSQASRVTGPNRRSSRARRTRLTRGIRLYPMR